MAGEKVYPYYSKTRGPRGGKVQIGWTIRYRDHLGRYRDTRLKGVSFEDAKRLASEYAARARLEQLGASLPAERVTVAEYARTFFASRQGLREASIFKDEEVYRLHVERSSIASMPLAALNPPVIRQWYRAMRMRPRGGSLVAASIGVQLAADKLLTKIVRQAAMDGLFGRDAALQGDAWRKPWHGTTPGKLDLPGRATIPGGLRGMGAFLAACGEVGGDRLVTACAIAMVTGARRGELRALRWNESLYLLDAGGHALSRELAHEAVAARVAIPSHAAKNHKLRVRTLPVVDVARTIARWWQRDAAGASSPWVFAADDRLVIRGRVVGEPGRQLVHAVDDGQWRAVKVRTGVDAGLRFHDLRGTYAKWLEESGAPITAIQELLDHESIETTERYLRQLNPEPRAAAYVEAAFAGLTIPTTAPEPAPLREVAAVGVSVPTTKPDSGRTPPESGVTRAPRRSYAGIPREATGRGLSGGEAATPYGTTLREARVALGLSADRLGTMLAEHFENAGDAALARHKPRAWGQRIYRLEAGKAAIPEHERRAVGDALAHLLDAPALRFVPAHDVERVARTATKP